ncbi:MAG TPA: hypothetical protein VES60_03280 [Nakamurella sp.]|nr:hypothetical protein [Nakamurella sp.]
MYPVDGQQRDRIRIGGRGLGGEVEHRDRVVIVLASLIVLVGVPLVHLLPSWGSAGLWVLVLGLVGLVIVVVSTTLEKSRAALHQDLIRFEKATSDWE